MFILNKFYCVVIDAPNFFLLPLSLILDIIRADPTSEIQKLMSCTCSLYLIKLEGGNVQWNWQRCRCKCSQSLIKPGWAHVSGPQRISEWSSELTESLLSGLAQRSRNMLTLVLKIHIHIEQLFLTCLCTFNYNWLTEIYWKTMGQCMVSYRPFKS